MVLAGAWTERKTLKIKQIGLTFHQDVWNVKVITHEYKTDKEICTHHLEVLGQYIVLRNIRPDILEANPKCFLIQQLSRKMHPNK